MAIRQILRAGHPVLEQVAEPVVDPTTDAIARIVGDMIDTLDAAGASGIAAPQIGVSLRLVVYFAPSQRCTARPGDDPLAVRIGGSMFALRRREAQSIRVRRGSAAAAGPGAH